MGRITVKEIGGGSMSLEASLALAGLVLLALGVVAAARRASVTGDRSVQARQAGRVTTSKCRWVTPEQVVRPLGALGRAGALSWALRTSINL